MKRKKTNKFQLLVSSAALLLILLVAVGITYSWIEGGATYLIKTDNSGDIRTGKAPVANIVNTLTIDPSSNNEIDLNQFDKTSNSTQELYFSEVCSSDGENFYFPVFNNGDSTSYREANTNDIGTKFIKYDFDLRAANNCCLYFAEAPSITATAKDGTRISDTSAFRIMLKSNDGTSGVTRHIFTTADVEQTSSVVSDEDGTPAELTAEPVSDYVCDSPNSKIIFDFNANTTKNITVSVWLDAEKAKSELIGAEVKLDFKLKATISELYFQPNNNWIKENNQRFAMYLFDSSTGENTWVSMTEDNSGYYKAKIPTGKYDKVIFCRMDGSTTENNWNNKWNQTVDLYIPIDNRLCYKINDSCSIWDTNKATGTWTDIP